MSNVAFGKTMENVRKYRHVQFVTTEARKNYLISESNYHTTKKKNLSENLLAIKMRKTQIFMNKPAFLGLPILELSKTVMHEFWYDYVIPKYCEKTKLY